MGQVVSGMMFPAPPSSYSFKTLQSPPLYMIHGVPCLWYTCHPVRPRGIILYLHANGVDLGMIRARLHRMARETEHCVLAVEYPGYGVHRGDVSPEGAVAAARKGFEHAAKQLPVVVVGRSIGTGVAAELCRQIGNHPRLRVVVLISPFVSVEEMGRRIAGEIGAMMTYGTYSTVKNIAEVQAPVMVVHGTRDKFIPIEQGRAVYAAAAKSTRRKMIELPGSDHTTLDWITINAEIALFFREEDDDGGSAQHKGVVAALE